MQYKHLVRKRIARIKRANPRFRNIQLADKMGIEPSYLSRFLSDPNVHFSDDLLFSMLKELKMHHDEIEEVMILKELERCSHVDRKSHLEIRLKTLRAKNILTEIDAIKAELMKIVDFLKLPFQ